MEIRGIELRPSVRLSVVYLLHLRALLHAGVSQLLAGAHDAQGLRHLVVQLHDARNPRALHRSVLRSRSHVRRDTELTVG